MSMDPCRPSPPPPVEPTFVVLFLCTANSCRSQLAEALTAARWPGVLALSSGVRPGPRVDPRALAVLRERGVPHEEAHPKTMDEIRELLRGRPVDLVVTVCDAAGAECPSFRPARKQVHRAFRDPPALAQAAGDGVDPLPFYREVCDEIAAFVDSLPTLLPGLAATEGLAASPSASSVSCATPVGAAGAECALLPPASPQAEEEAAPPSGSITDGDAVLGNIPFFERWLSLWVLLCMVAGALIGYFAPVVAAGLGTAQFAQINAVVAVLIWVMILPMLIQIDFHSLVRVKDSPAAIALTSGINYLAKPFSMFGLAVLFLKVFYVNVIPDAALRDSYLAGLILLAGAPCTAMVFCWSSLVGGDAAYTLVQVAFNDLLMLGLYVPTCVLLIGVSTITLPWVTIIYAVALFIAAPLVLAAVLRTAVLRTGGQAALDACVQRVKPVTTVALLAMLLIIFIFQGQKIGSKPLDIVLLAIPITIQCVLMFSFCYAVGAAACIPHRRLAPAALIATSNFFELAVAVAIAVYGPDSGAALATVVGVLVEVPVMLALVHVCNALRPRLERRCHDCPELCGWAITGSKRMLLGAAAVAAAVRGKGGCGGGGACCGGGGGQPIARANLDDATA